MIMGYLNQEIMVLMGLEGVEEGLLITGLL
jgi:hypothetical protein